MYFPSLAWGSLPLPLPPSSQHFPPPPRPFPEPRISDFHSPLIVGTAPEKAEKAAKVKSGGVGRCEGEVPPKSSWQLCPRTQLASHFKAKERPASKDSFLLPSTTLISRALGSEISKGQTT